MSALRNIDPARAVHEPFVLSMSTLSTSSTRVQRSTLAEEVDARLREQADRAIARAALTKVGIS